MNREEIVNTLRNLGLGDYESRVYSALLFLEHSKASEISKESNVPQSKIYEVLDRLIERKLVEVYTVRPKEFRVIAPEVMLKNLTQEKEKEINEIKKKVNLLVKSLKSMPVNTEVFEGVWTSKEKGWRTFFDRVCEMYDRSEKYVYVISKNFSWSSRLADSFKASIRRGVEVRGIGVGEIDESKYHRAKWFNDQGAKIRILKTKIHPSLIDVDGREVLLRLDANPTKRKKFVFTSIYSRDLSLVRVIDTYVKNLWKRAKVIKLDKIKGN